MLSPPDGVRCPAERATATFIRGSDMYKQMAIAIALSCVCATAMAGYGFEPIAALAPDAAGARAVAVGDVTGDGRDDVVLLGGGSHPFFRNRVVLYAQTPAGFAPPVAIDYHPES